MLIGFYRKTGTVEFHQGDIIAVCLPRVIAEYGLAQGYLQHGHCSAESIAVLKQVIALPGDTIQLTNQAIVVNGVRYFFPYQAYDRLGRRMDKFVANGIYKSIGYWLYGSHDVTHSWDSRYYGPVARENIIGVYKPLLTF